MLVTNEQLIELLAEAAGTTSENIERQLEELTSEIEQAISENEAYEIEGFGIFSGIGNRIMFIPSKELETEINYKYVGMEPIEIDAPEPDEEEEDDPFSGIIDDGVEEASKKSNPFAGLVEGLDELSDEEEEEQPGSDQWGVEAHKEDDSAGRLFASLMGQDYTPSEDEDDAVETDEDEFDQFGDVFGGTEEDDNSSEELSDELSSLMSDDPKEESKIDAYNESSSFLDDLIEDASDDATPPTEEKEELEDTVEDIITEEELLAVDSDESPFDFDDDEEDEAISIPDELNDTSEEEDEDDELDLEKQLAAMDDDSDFDDPFSNLDAPEVDDELVIDSVDDEDIVPVIKNLSSEGVSKTEEKEKKETKPEKKKKEKKKAENKTEQQPAPAWLWAVFLVVIAGSAVVALGYFKVINIPFITPQVASNTVTPITPPANTQPSTPPPAQDQTAPEQQPETVTEQPVTTPTEAETTPLAEQPEVAAVPESDVTLPPAGNNPEKYGLTGELSAEGYDGYTIILYSLSNKENATREVQKLAGDGYRAMLMQIPSERFGTLYRVCIGQFGSLYDAAVAAEDIMDILPENYLIKKIN